MSIYIASHKYLPVPNLPHYQPLFVGAHKLCPNDRRQDWEYDDRAENISSKNATYCELTGLYWIWKHCKDNVVGLVHYRRFLADPFCKAKKPLPLTRASIEKILDTHDCIVAQPSWTAIGNELISLAEQYRLCHVSTDLIMLQHIIRRYYPQYYESFLEVMMGNSFSPFNILVCRKELLDSYSSWLFSILKKVERVVDPWTDRNNYQARVFGFLAERLLNVYTTHHRLRTYHCRVFDPASGLFDTTDSASRTQLHSRNASEIEIPNILPQHNGITYQEVFDYRFYLTHYSDIARAYIHNPQDSIQHFLAYGAAEDRMAHPRFSIKSYINGNPHLRACFGKDTLAYIHHYIQNRSDRAHAIGYENLFCPDKPSRANTAESRVRRLYYKRKLMYAERCGVLD